MGFMPPGMPQNPIDQYLSAMKAQQPKPPQAPVPAPMVPQTPANKFMGAFGGDDFQARIKKQQELIAQRQQQIQTDLSAMAQMQPDLGPAPQYNAPQYQPPQFDNGQGLQSRGFQTGALLGALLGGGHGQAAGLQLQHDEQQREKKYARDSEQAQQQYQVQAHAADAQFRAEQAAEQHRLALAQAAEKQSNARLTADQASLDRETNTLESMYRDQGRNMVSQQRAQTAADKVFADIGYHKGLIDLRSKALGETAKWHAQQYKLRNAQFATQVHIASMRDAATMYSAGLRADASLMIASRREQASLMVEKMRENAGVLKAAMGEKYGADMKALTEQIKGYDGIIAAARNPLNKDNQKVQDAAHAAEANMTDLVNRIQADSAGKIAAPQLKVLDELQNAAQSATESDLPQPSGAPQQPVTLNVNLNGAPGMTPPGVQGALAGEALGSGPASDIYHKYGLTPGGTQQHPTVLPGAAGGGRQPHAHGVPPHSTTPATSDSHLAAEAIRAANHDPQKIQTIVTMYARNHGMTEPQARAALGLDAPGGWGNLAPPGGSHANGNPPGASR